MSTLTKTNTNTPTAAGAKKGLSQRNQLYFAKLASFIVLSVMSVCMLAGGSITAFASGGDAGSFNTVVNFIVVWVQRIGGVIGFIGAIQFGMAFKNDDADGKTRGLMTLASGFIVIAICLAYTQLFQQG